MFANFHYLMGFFFLVHLIPSFQLKESPRHSQGKPFAGTSNTSIQHIAHYIHIPFRLQLKTYIKYIKWIWNYLHYLTSRHSLHRYIIWIIQKRITTLFIHTVFKITLPHYWFITFIELKRYLLRTFQTLTPFLLLIFISVMP